MVIKFLRNVAVPMQIKLDSYYYNSNDSYKNTKIWVASNFEEKLQQLGMLRSSWFSKSIAVPAATATFAAFLFHPFLLLQGDMQMLRRDSGVYRSFSARWTRGGVQSFWEGSVASSFRVCFTETTTLFLRRHLDSYVSSQASPWVKFGLFTLSGATAGLATQLLFYHWEVAALLRACTPVSSLLEVYVSLWRRGGLAGLAVLYRGFPSAALRGAVFRAVQLGLLSTSSEEDVDSYVDSFPQDGSIRARRALRVLRELFPYLCTTFAAVVALPLDCIKKRRQQSLKVKLTTRQVIRLIYREKGFRGFFLGLKATLIYNLGTAIVLVSCQAIVNRF